jgi:uncharacterized protein YkwD
MRRMWVAVAVLAVGALAEAAPTSAPVLRVRAVRSGVNVHWTYKGDVAPAGSTLEIQRAAGNGAFALVGTVARPRRRAAWTDSLATPGTYAYRARVVAPGATTAWSDAVSVTVGTTASGGGLEPGTPQYDPPLPAGQRECPTGSTAEVLRLVNEVRRAQGRAPLADNAALDRAARTHTIDNVASQNLTHTGWVTYIRNAGYAAGFLGENIAYGYQSAASVVQGWLGSSDHRANILSSSYRDSGVGCVMDSRGRLWWTQDFGG